MINTNTKNWKVNKSGKKREYHVKENGVVAHKYVKMFCSTNYLPSLKFCDPNTKTHGVRGLSKNYHMKFDPKIGRGTCVISQIPFDCVEYISMLDTPWVYGLPPSDQPHYQPVTYFT